MRSLEARVERLEERHAAVPAVSAPDEAATRAKMRILRSRLYLSGYNNWRHIGLSLEQLLALARDDGRFARANPRESWSPGYRKEQPGQWVDLWPGVGARELEIRILERDRRIDETAAAALRVNLHEHFFQDTGALQELPAAIDFDEAASLRSARAQCPRRSTLPLEQQLAMLNEDHEHGLGERERPATSDLVVNATSDSLAKIRDRMHGDLVKDLQCRIRQRDAGQVITPSGR
jgi:hypothetical protein